MSIHMPLVFINCQQFAIFLKLNYLKFCCRQQEALPLHAVARIF